MLYFQTVLASTFFTVLISVLFFVSCFVLFLRVHVIVSILCVCWFLL
jgi:hypothetical protein